MVLRAVASEARALGLAGRRVLVAVSGGVDSSVLLHALWTLAPRLDLSLAVGHVNHGLRGVESDADEQAVLAAAAALGLPARSRRVAPERLREGLASRVRPTLQEAARRARYEALEKLAAAWGAERIATAHTLDDQAETVLLRLLRGTGPDGLGGIPPRSPDGRVVRPLLRVSRAAIERHARAERLIWREDPSNRDRRFARGRLRAGGLAELAASLNPRWLRAIGDLAEAQREESAWLEEQAREEVARRVCREADGLRIDAAGFEALPEPLARRVARSLLREAGAGRDVSRPHVLRTAAFLRRARVGACLELPGGLRLARRREGFLLGGGVHPDSGC